MGRVRAYLVAEAQTFGEKHAQHFLQDTGQRSEQAACHPEHIRSAQGKLREGSGSMGAEMLRGVYPERSEGLSMTVRIPIKSAHREAFSPNVWQKRVTRPS